MFRFFENRRLMDDSLKCSFFACLVSFILFPVRSMQQAYFHNSS